MCLQHFGPFIKVASVLGFYDLWFIILLFLFLKFKLEESTHVNSFYRSESQST
jgi:hypothetical protein